MRSGRRPGWFLAAGGLICCLLAGGLLAADGSGPRTLKLRLRRVGGPVAPGESAPLTLLVKNRTKENVTEVIDLTYRDSGDRFEELTVSLAPKEKRVFDLTCPVPAGQLQKKLIVEAHGGGASSRTKVKLDLSNAAGLTDLEWQEGKDLYVSLCARCHGQRGGGVRKDSLSRWKQAMRQGPGSMPKYPDSTPTEIFLMREYTRDADRELK